MKPRKHSTEFTTRGGTVLSVSFTYSPPDPGVFGGPPVAWRQPLDAVQSGEGVGLPTVEIREEGVEPHPLELGELRPPAVKLVENRAALLAAAGHPEAHRQPELRRGETGVDLDRLPQVANRPSHVTPPQLRAGEKLAVGLEGRWPRLQGTESHQPDGLTRPGQRRPARRAQTETG